MRTVFILAAVLLASIGSARAETVQLSHGMWRVPIAEAPPTSTPFRFSTSETAYVEHIPANGAHVYTAGDGAHIAALFADLANGIANPLTWSTGEANLTVDENYLFSEPYYASPLAGSALFFSPAETDFGPFVTVESVRITSQIRIDPPGVTSRAYFVTIRGTLPEPSSAMLFVLGVCGVHGYQRRNVRVKVSGNWAPVPAESTST